jgi:hypothetical protein
MFPLFKIEQVPRSSTGKHSPLLPTHTLPSLSHPAACQHPPLSLCLWTQWEAHYLPIKFLIPIHIYPLK